MRGFRLPCILLVLILTAPAIAGERAGSLVLEKMPTDLRQMVDGFHKGKWKDALDILARIEGSFGEIALSLERVVSIAAMDEVSFAIDDLGKALKDKDPTRSQTAYWRLQEKYLDICERFDFQIPPPLQLVQLDFEAATRLQGEKDLSLVARNLADAYSLLPWLEEAMQRANVEPNRLRVFRTSVREAKAAAEKGDREQLAIHLKDGLTQLPDFIFRSLKAATPGNGNK